MGYSQSFQDTLQINEAVTKPHKSTKVEQAVSFKSDLKEKYNDKEFVYTDDLKEPEPRREDVSPTTNNGFLAAFVAFMTYIFPFVLGIIIVLIILKIVLGADMGFWNFKKSTKQVADKLVYEEEGIHDTDFNKLLEKAIEDTNFRLATRYYYLSLLKKLSDLKTIEYHKDKTNTEYVFEIENKDLRNQFSEVSYIYSYVWYGEFPIDSLKFKTIENKYKSIFKSIH
ncbi:hypothetical protein [Xanthomarina sp.]|uniref:hypothetical protein n=1 Tax=Xanthomarina sp. TaxID=1931211 RepID=UPI002C080565|nr:hypothetical protein [Xanthomarina sp.]HLV39402.1 hypothetical protein [Xanthomarina sp.]